MMQLALHPTPRRRDVVIEQVRAVGLALRPVALVAAVVVGIVTLLVASEGGRGAEMQFGSDSWLGTSVVSFLFPFAVWRREKRFGPAFLWTLPVDRRRLALAKVFAGWVWLMTALAVIVGWLLVLTLLSDATAVRSVLWSWLVRFPGATAMYLLGSALVLGLRHPLRWLLGTAGVLYLQGTFNEALGPYTLLNSSGFFSAAEDATAVWRNLPDLARWATTTFLWFGAGLAALWAAVSRHGERRRH